MRKFYETDELICYFDFNKRVIKIQLNKQEKKMLFIFASSGKIVDFNATGFLNELSQESKSLLAIYEIPTRFRNENQLIKMINSWVTKEKLPWTVVTDVSRGKIMIKEKVTENE